MPSMEEMANGQGLNLGIDACIENIGGNCMALMHGISNGRLLVITQEGAGIYSSAQAWDNGDEADAIELTYDADLDNSFLNTPWAIANEADALKALAECVALNLCLLKDEANGETIEGWQHEGVEDCAAYALKVLVGNCG